MKLQAIYQNNKGFLVMEALLALSLMTLLFPAALALSWSNGGLRVAAQDEIDKLSGVGDLIQHGTNEQFASSTSEYAHEFGRNTCSLTPSDPAKGFTSAEIYTAGAVGAQLSFGTSAVGTSLSAHNGFVYEITQPPSRTQPDFFIIDDRNLLAPVMLSSLVTGPGLASIAVAGYYAYLANQSTVSQLRIVDIHDRTHPAIVASLKLPLPEASATEALASSIFYDNGYIYLGTQKGEGSEMNIVNVLNSTVPTYVNGFETGSQINSIYENNGRVYIAMPATDDQMDIIDVTNPQLIRDLSHVAPAGSAVLEGRDFAYNSGALFETASATGTLYFGRAGGGFNNSSQYELFSYDLSRDPYAQNPIFTRDISGGVYGIVYCNGYVFLATGDPSAEFQIWKSDFSEKVYSAQLPSKPVSLVCDHDRLYVTLSNPVGFAAIIPH